MRFFTCLTDDHNLWLVGLAAALCLIGSVITFRLFRRLRAAETGTRLAWSFMGAVATGATIWCTHFVAMIAYEPGADGQLRTPADRPVSGRGHAGQRRSPVGSPRAPCAGPPNWAAFCSA